jgi:hypothetical protein
LHLDGGIIRAPARGVKAGWLADSLARHPDSFPPRDPFD